MNYLKCLISGRLIYFFLEIGFLVAWVLMIRDADRAGQAIYLFMWGSKI